MSDDASGSSDRPNAVISRRRILMGGGAVAALAATGAGLLLSRTPVGVAAGRSRARAVHGDLVPPKSVDVVIIGGGYVGASAALALAERGIPVALCEKGVIAGEASGRSMGYVDSQMLDPSKLELVGRSKVLWSQLNSRINLDTGYRPTGLVETLPGPEAEAGAEAWLATTRGMPGIEGRIVRGPQITQLFPGVIDPPAAALHTPTDASVEPELAAPAIADGARCRGASILQYCAVRGIETRAGRVCGVVTEKGPIACQAVVLAGGVWSSLFMRSLGLSLPQLNVYLSMMGLTAVPGPTIPLSADGYGFRPHRNGKYSFGVVDFAAPIEPATFRNLLRLWPAIESFWPMAEPGFSPAEFWNQLWTPSSWPLDQPSPFEARRILVPQFRAEPLERALVKLRQHFPVFKAARVREHWAGAVCSTPDNMPVISPAPAIPGVFLGTAFTFGLTMGPAAGEALADLATGRDPIIKLHDYRFERFNDGSVLRFRA